MSKQVIICVDDEQTILNSLKIELKKALSEEYLIETAEDGEEALELLTELLEDEYEIPLVISDYIMPNMKGDELLKQIHIISPKTLKIMLTGQADAEGVGNAINYAKLYRYIAKPWQAEDLKLTITEAIHSYLQGKRLLEQHAQLQYMNQTLQQLNKAYERFVPRQFLSLLDKQSIIDINLGDQVEKVMTVLFSDIRGFTSLSETLSPRDNFEFLNTYLGQMEPIIGEHQGFIDKYIGDAIMALFPTEVDEAIQAAIAMLRKLIQYNDLLQRAGFSPLRIGIGLNTGALMLGTLGGQTRMDGTVISDAVNVASRIEGLTKIYGVSLLMTELTYAHIQDPSRYNIRLLDRVQVKGRSQPVSVYEVFDADPEAVIRLKLKTLADFEQGFHAYHQQQFDKAQSFFAQVVAVNRYDEAARVYLSDCNKKISMQIPTTPTILVVDDMPYNLSILFELLTGNYFEVLVAENGENALQLLEYNSPHLI
ncbi:MAG: adenylate/guanylate cyclase domain-containing protein, partial [Pseudomonadota bacterium]|nr:adenylate/guanylate cyclase domain-containing protein [Pseudomonadota bacterium]